MMNFFMILLFIFFIFNATADANSLSAIAEEELILSIVSDNFNELKTIYCKLDSIADDFKQACEDFLNSNETIDNQKNCFCHGGELVRNLNLLFNYFQINREKANLTPTFFFKFKTKIGSRNAYICNCCNDLVAIDDVVLELYREDKLSGFFDFLIEQNHDRIFNYDLIDANCDVFKLNQILNGQNKIAFFDKALNQFNFNNCEAKELEQHVSWICELTKNQTKFDEHRAESFKFYVS